MAEKLEKAAKSDDLDFVNENNAVLLAAAQRLLENIEKVLAEVDAGCAKEKRDKPDTGVLRKLSSACEGYDIDGINEVMKEVDAYDYEAAGDLIVWLKDNILEGNFDEIAARVSEMITQESA